MREVELNAPWYIPQEAIDVALSWATLKKSPYGWSLYDTNEKDWNHTPLGSHRIANHWNFISRGEVHCRTDKSVKKNRWYLGRWDGEQYVIEREFPLVRFDTLPREKARQLSDTQLAHWEKASGDPSVRLDREARRASKTR